ncbi:MAG: tRNA pseudouridine(55) synthase TruB [Chlamydiales bacterium]|nr:tRNA pseudouridine(55) synthase TruB [Chlamydiales bacterium]
MHDLSGILLIDKPAGRSSFSLIPVLRRLTGVQTIGHAGTLDPFATGVLVMLVGRSFTKQSDQFLASEKEYRAQVKLGIATDTFDCDGKPIATSEKVPSLQEIEECLKKFQGKILQTPPMFSAKKVKGKKLYELARKGIEIERAPVEITLSTTLISYAYPFLDLTVACSKGTYIRSIADELGRELGCFGHLSSLVRTRSGSFNLSECHSWEQISSPSFDFKASLKK